MRPRTLALAGLAMAAVTTAAFLLIDEPAHDRVKDVRTFGDATFTISEERPDPPPHAFAVVVPQGATSAGLLYHFRLSADDRPGGQEAPINVILAVYVDGEEGRYRDTTPLGEEKTYRSVIDFGLSSSTSFAERGRIAADLTPGFHVIQFRIDATDRMTEDWEWKVEPQEAELRYSLSNGWRGGPAPLVGLIAGLLAAVVLLGWAIKDVVEPRNPPL